MSDKRPSLLALIEQRLESGAVELPVFDGITLRIHRAMREQTLDADGICRLLQEDPVLAGEVLRVANSSFFRGLFEVRSLREASVRLGIKQLVAITVSVSQKRLYSASKGPFRSRLVLLWRHVSAVSACARWLAAQTGYKSLADEVAVAGLLHDVGKLSLLRIIEDIALEGRGKVRLTNELVNAVLDKMHCEHGARLLDLWELPETFKTIVRHQEDREFDDTNISLCIIRLSDKVCALEGVSDRPDRTLALETLHETHVLGLDDIDLAELRLVAEDYRDGRMPKPAQAA